MTWLNDLPSGAWAVIGALIAGLISYGSVVWQNRAQLHREQRFRVDSVADRTRNERRTAYAALLVSARKAEKVVDRFFNEEQFNFGPPGHPGIENYDLVWEKTTGDFDERYALARLVASDSVQTQIGAVYDYLNEGVFAIAEIGKKPNPDPNPIKTLEDLFAEELQYRARKAEGSA